MNYLKKLFNFNANFEFNPLTTSVKDQPCLQKQESLTPGSQRVKITKLPKLDNLKNYEISKIGQFK